MSAGQSTHNDRCFRLLRRYDYRYQSVERFLRFRGAFRREDFGGFADVLAWRPITPREVLAELDGFHFTGALAIQICGDDGLWPHLDKLTQGTRRDDLRDWLLAGNRCEIWAFPRAARVHKTRGAVGVDRRLVVRFLRLSHDAEFYYEETTELTCFGYRIAANGDD